MMRRLGIFALVIVASLTMGANAIKRGPYRFDARVRSHATDCTLLTDGLPDELCYELDSDRIFACEPAVSPCNIVADWVLVSGGGGGAPTTAAYLTLALDAGLSVERDASGLGGRSITCTDTGANGTFTCVADAETYTDTKCMNIDPALATTSWLMWRASAALTITGVDCLVEDATSTVATLQECDANGDACTAVEAAMTCLVTNTTEAAGVDNTGIDAGDYLRVLRGANVGAPAQLIMCFEFTWDD